MNLFEKEREIYIIELKIREKKSKESKEREKELNWIENKERNSVYITYITLIKQKDCLKKSRRMINNNIEIIYK